MINQYKRNVIFVIGATHNTLVSVLTLVLFSPNSSHWKFQTTLIHGEIELFMKSS